MNTSSLPVIDLVVSNTVLIVGGGPAGLATARMLNDRGIRSIVIEQADRVGNSWLAHYDNLKLHTSRRFSGLPGKMIPKSLGKWVPSTEYQRYLEEYAGDIEHVDILTGVEVKSIIRDDSFWIVTTDKTIYRAPFVVMASGLNQQPHVPLWPGHHEFRGVLMHSSEYKNVRSVKGARVLVVGVGNSGAEIASELAKDNRDQVLLSVRSGPNILPRSVFGIPMQFMGIAFGWMPAPLMNFMIRIMQRMFLGNLRKLGLPSPPDGVVTQIKDKRRAPIIDVGLLKQLRKGTVSVVPSVSGFDQGSVEFSDGTKQQIDTVIAATGYTSGLNEIFVMPIPLDDMGVPELTDTLEATHARGVFFPGYAVAIGGVLREIGLQSECIAKAIQCKLKDANNKLEENLSQAHFSTTNSRN